MKWIKVNWPRGETGIHDTLKMCSLEGGVGSTPTEATSSDVKADNMVKLAKVGVPGSVAISEHAIQTYGVIEPVWLKDGDVWITHADDPGAVLHFYVHLQNQKFWTLGASEKAYSFIKKLHDNAD